MSTAVITRRPAELSLWAVLPLRVLHAWISAPVLCFLLALTAMLFRPPDLKWFPWDRVCLIVLIACVAARWCIQRQPLRIFAATWPMLVLMALGFWGVISQRYDPQSWSLFAAKWIVPVMLFHAAGLVFHDDRSLRTLDWFCVGVLIYLSFISVFSLADLKSVIYPRFILDEGIGIHADRARGPFLQAVANGVSINILGLLALDSFRRRKLPVLVSALLLVIVPIALLATKTRAVWLSAAISVAMLLVFSRERRLLRAAFTLCALVAVGLGFVLIRQMNSNDFLNRLKDESPVDFRSEMYSAGWQMFLDKPLTGWGSDQQVQNEVARRVSNFHPEYYVFHNTFLELAVTRGMVGLGFYAWMMVCFFRLARSSPDERGTFSDLAFRKLWMVILAVYLVNASAVVMNYQFVNGLVFTLAGILAARQRPKPGWSVTR